jgi:Ca2+-binding RTX toxin-like protein
MADDMTVIDASALASFDYTTYLADYFSSTNVGTTRGSSTYYSGTSTEGFGYYSGSEVGFRYTTDPANTAQVLLQGENIAYDGIYNAGHGISGDVDGFTLGYYTADTTYTQDDEAGTRSELTGVVNGLVVSGLDYSTAVGTGTVDSNLVSTLYYALQKANTVVDLDNDGTSGLEYVDQIYTLLSAKAQHFIGSAGDDNYVGTAYGDLIDGGAGADTLAGGAGDDTYIVDDADDVVTENADGGTDTVQTSLNHYQIGDNVENLTLTGSENLFGYGNGLDNVITGNSGANTLYGLAGNDTLNGGAGADTMVGGTGDDVYYLDVYADTLTENADEGTDTIVTAYTHLQIRANIENIIQTGTAGQFSYGNTLNNTMTATPAGGNLYGMEGTDTLIGGVSADVLDGGTDADVMIGGDGNDSYTIDNVGDVVTEASNAGTDTVSTSLDNYVLADNFENLTLLGSDDDDTADADLNGSGNSVANTVIGNDGANRLYGLGGIDKLYGGAGNDVLDGGTGADVLTGGAGNDTYVVDRRSDTIVELNGGGTDTVRTSVSLTLGDYVENLTLTGDAALSANGNALANTLTGNVGDNVLKGLAGADVLSGKAGADSLYGGAGIDTLSGGAGADTFYFAAGDTAAKKASADTITDFKLKQHDMIDLASIDANENKKGNQAFDFIGDHAFSHTAGELRYVEGKSDTYIYGDTDGDGKADFTIHLDGAYHVKDDFFAL